MVEEDERANRLLGQARQQTFDREAAEITLMRFEQMLNAGHAGISKYRVSRLTGLAGDSLGFMRGTTACQQEEAGSPQGWRISGFPASPMRGIARKSG
ncbi:hypothetical protein GCM10027296_16050 [Chitinimonas naiadis]